MRGKNILWLCMIATLLSVMLVHTGVGVVGNTKLSIDPKRLPEQAGTLGHKGDIYLVSVRVDNVNNLWAVGFTVNFAPFVRTLTASEFLEGPFLKTGWTAGTFFKVVPDAFEGTIQVVIARIGSPGTPPVGASGDGVLMTFKLNVIEAGNSPIDLTNTVLIDPDLNPMVHNVFNGYYYGATADLVGVEMPAGRHIRVGTPAVFKITVRNDGDVPIAIQGMLEVERAEDGRRVRLYSGQTYYGGYLGAEPPSVELMCDGYYEALEWDWNHYGDSPWLDAVGDGNLVNSTTSDAMTSMYTFEDLSPLMPYQGIYYVISNVDFYGYSRISDTANDIDPYAFTVSGGESYDWCWADSMGTSTDWSWSGLKYYAGQYNMPEYYGYPLTTEAVDNTELLLNYYGPSGVVMEVDALKMLIEFATIVPLDPAITIVQPGETAELELITWVPVPDHIGAYSATVSIQYSEVYPNLGYHFRNVGDKVRTFTFWVTD